MAKFQVGHKLSPGRAPGSLNKRTVEFIEVLAAKKFNVPTAMLEIYAIALQRFTEELEKQDSGAISPMESQAPKYLKMCADLLIAMSGYAYPKLKAIEQKKDNPLDGMSPQEKLEAMKHAVAMLEIENKTGR
jgi:hypothetical protein